MSDSLLCYVYDNLFLSFKEALILFDESGKIVSWNKYAEDLLRVNSEELKSMHNYDLQLKYYTPTAKTKPSVEELKFFFSTVFDNLHRSGKQINSDFQIKYENGETKDIFSISQPIEFENQRYLAFIFREDKNNKLLRMNLEYRLKFESLLNDISAEFVKIEPENLDKSIDNSLSKLIDFTHSDAAVFYKIKDATLEPTNVSFKEPTNLDKLKIKRKLDNVHKWIYSLISENKKIEANIVFDNNVLPKNAIKFLKLLGLSNILIVPVKLDDKVVAAIAVFNALIDNSWKNEDVNLIKVFSDILIAAIDRVDKQKMIECRLRDSQILNDVSQFVLKESDINTVSRFIFRKAIELSKSKSGVVCYFDEKKYIPIITGYCKTVGDTIEFFDKMVECDSMKGIVAALRTIDEAYYSNEQEESMANVVIDHQGFSFQKYLSSPAILYSNRVGHIFIANKETDYDENDLGILSKLSQLLSLAINRHKMQEKIFDSEEKFRNLIDNATDGIFLWEDDKYSYINPKYCEMVGYSLEEMMSDNFNPLVLLTENSQELIKSRAVSRERGEEIENSYKLEYVKKDGSRFDSEITVINVSKSVEKESRLCVVKDISARKQFEEMIQRRDAILNSISYASEKFLKKSNWQENIVEILDKFLTITDSSAVYLFRNKYNSQATYSSICTHYSLTSDENYKFDIDFILKNNFHEFGLNSWYNKLEKKKKVVAHYDELTSEEVLMLKGFHFSSLTFIPIFIKDNFWGFLLIQNNLTKHNWLINELEAFDTASEIIAAAILREQNEQQLGQINLELEKRVVARTNQLEDALKELQDEIAIRKNIEFELMKSKNEIMIAWEKEKELSELRSRFINMVSHEYRTPLTVVLSSTFLLERALGKNDLSTSSKHLDKIRIAVKQMTHLLENVMMSGRMEADSYEPSLRTFDIAMMIESIIDEIKIIDKFNHPINFIKDLPNSMISADETLFNLVLNNLLNNAVRYSPIGSNVEFYLSQQNDSLKIVVKDNGYGITDKDRKHIFSPFYRGETNENTSGTGLGLSLVKRSVDMLKGTIEFDSEVGKGTEFRVFIPVMFIKQNI